jgi:hypothetical protein
MSGEKAGGRFRCGICNHPASYPVPTPNPMPEFVRVLGVDVPLLLTDPREHVFLRDCHGYADGDRGAIVLNQNTSLEKRRDTVLHEVLHFLERALRTELEEEQLGRMGRGLFAVLRDNPALVAWLMEDA